MFDGLVGHVGGTPSGSMYASYLPSVQDRAARTTPVLLSALYTAVGSEGHVTVDVGLDQALAAGDRELLVLVCRDGWHGQSYMVVDRLDPEPVTVQDPADTQQVERTFAVDPAWIQDELKVVVLVQDAATDEILQAALAVPDYKGQVVVDCEPDGVGAGWQLVGPGGLSLAGAGDEALSVFLTGTYMLDWEAVPYWTAPSGPQALTVQEDGTVTFTGVYTGGPFAEPAAGAAADGGPGRGAVPVDFDGDGDLDLHVPNDGRADLLLRNDGGVFTDVAAGDLADTGPGQTAAWHDVDGDGHLDVYLGRDGETDLLLLGDGAGGFAPGNTFGLETGGNARATSWTDYDGDGLLDLYVVDFGGANRLYRYNGVMGGGYLVFSPVTNGADLVGNHTGAAWNDIDGDGDLDLYVLTAFGQNRLLENMPLGFNDITSQANLGDNGNAQGAAWGDFDNDGDLDLYVANDGTADRLWRTEDWDTYNLVIGEHLGDTGSGRGVVWADFDNDTFLDLYVARRADADLLLFGHGDGTFTRAPVGAPGTLVDGNGVACADLDGDGGLDLYLARDFGANVLLTNTVAAGNHWFAVELAGPQGNPLAIGARVQVTAGGVTQTRLVTGGDGLLGRVGGPVHFGLGADALVETLTVTWPDGTVQTAGPLAADQRVTVVPGQEVSGVDDRPVEGPPPAHRLEAAYPNPFNPSTTIAFALARGGRARLDVYAVDGAHVRTLVDGALPAGPHRATWLGRDDAGRPVASGTYLYRLVAPDGARLSGRVTLVK